MNTRRTLVIAAAGRGTRLHAAVPKVLVEVNGRPMLHHLLHLYRPFVTHAVVVAAPDAVDAVAASASTQPLETSVTVQAGPTGMLDAVLLGTIEAAHLTPARVWVTWGDQIGVMAETLERVETIEAGSDLALPTVEREQPYTHLVRDASGRITSALERREGDSMPPTGECDMGIFSLSPRCAFDWLPCYARDARPGARTAERNFLPFVAWVAAQGRVVTCAPTHPMEAIGINTPEELERMAAWIMNRC
jgi:bifunctional UDP-N-acetylglucosamine pyrophosphorylase/glucosamine-1-phosphate N-acetyltransferase